MDLHWSWSDGQLWVYPAPAIAANVAVYHNGYDLSAFDRAAEGGFDGEIMEQDVPLSEELVQLVMNRVQRRLSEMSGDITKATYFMQQSYLLEREVRRVYGDDDFDGSTGVVKIGGI